MTPWRAFAVWLLGQGAWCASELKFPAGFKFGAATSSYQIEGAWNVSGKTPSIWDTNTHSRAHTIVDGSTGDVACDSYNRWQDDVQIAADLGLDFYRFSISWPRILPKGFPDYINKDGRRYYDNLINGLLEKGIEPVVTMYHWDMPQRLQNLGRLLKAFQIEFNWYQLASWVNLTEQWPFRTSWIIYHHEIYEEHIDDSTSLKHIYEKVKPSIGGVREAITLMELDRDERKLDVFLSFHRATLTAADLKIFLPFTINLDPYIKKVIKEEQVQAGAEDDIGAGAATAMSWGIAPNSRPAYPKPLHKKQGAQKMPPTPQPAHNTAPAQPMWVGWANPMMPTTQTYSHNIQMDNPGHQMIPAVASNPVTMLRTAFPGMTELTSLRLSTLSVERVCRVMQSALGAGGVAAAAALQRHRVCGLVLSVCHLNDLKPILELPFGDWELFKMLILNLRELESGMPINAPAVTVLTEKSNETETDTIKPRPALEHQRSRPSNVEKQVTLEEQMICGALQTLNEEAMEDVLQSEPSAPSDEAGERRAPAVSFSVENEDDDEGHITFTARPRARRAGPARPRPSSLRLSDDASDAARRLSARSLSVEDSARNGSPVLDLKLRNLRRTTDILRNVGSAERITRFKDKIMSCGPGSRDRSPQRDETASDDESAPLVSSPPGADPRARSGSCALVARPLGVDCTDRSPQDGTASTDFSPRSEMTDAESPRGSAPDFDLLPEGKSERNAVRVHFAREASDASLSNMIEPYNMRLLAHGTSDGSRGLWRQDALDSLDSGPPWPPHEPDSAV